MNINYEIIVFSDEWFGLPFSCKHLLQHFLPDHPLIWVETIGLRSPGLNIYDIKRGIKKIVGWTTRANNNFEIIPENLHIIDPLQIPYNHIELVRLANKKLLLRSLNHFSKRIPGKERIIISTWPFVGNLIGRLGEKLSIYYRVDDFSEFPGVRKESILKLEKELIDNVDMVVVTAENLGEFGGGEKEIHYLPHGVDYDHFSVSTGDDTDESGVARIPAPRIGFFGLFNEWIDLALLEEIALKEPNWSFVFIGPTQIPPSELPQLPNIHFLGPIPYKQLPQAAQHFNVGLIPFKINALTLKVNPLKLIEYLSLGLPVVSTPLPEVLKYKEHVEIASEPDGFRKAIEKALLGDNAVLHEERRKIAEKNSWKEKSNELKTWIEIALEKKIGLSNK